MASCWDNSLREIICKLYGPRPPVASVHLEAAEQRAGAPDTDPFPTIDWGPRLVGVPFVRLLSQADWGQHYNDHYGNHSFNMYLLNSYLLSCRYQ